MPVAEPPAQLCTQLQGRVPWPGCVDVVRGALWRCQPGPKVGALFSGELAALRGEVIDISPGNLDFSLCFIQPGILHDVL